MRDGFGLIDLVNSAGLVLGPQMTQNFSLILHELLTNALRYGALSVPRGRVSLRLEWISPLLTFTWQERDGAPVSPPLSLGLGSRILENFARSFCRNVEASYAPNGFRYTLQIHSDQIRKGESPIDPAPYAAGRIP